MLNPYAILGALAVWLASLVGVGYWQHDAGVSAQKVADQRQFDRINTERAQQADQANVMYRAKQAEVIAALAERDAFKNQLEKERGEHRAATDALAARYAGLQLRFRAAQGAAPGDRGGRADSAAPNAPGADAAPVVQLPDAVATDLRQLALDADRLRDEYATCYGYATGPVK